MSLEIMFFETPHCPHCGETIAKYEEEVFWCGTSMDLDIIWHKAGIKDLLCASPVPDGFELRIRRALMHMVNNKEHYAHPSYHSTVSAKYVEAIQFLINVLSACRLYPTARIEIY